MCDEILDDIKKDKQFYKDIEEEYKDFKSLSIVNKAVLSKQLFIDTKKYEKAIMIAGETINDLSIENEVLENKLNEMGVYDPVEIARKIKIINLKNNDQDKNNRIKRALQKTLEKSKMITNK